MDSHILRSPFGLHSTAVACIYTGDRIVALLCSEQAVSSLFSRALSLWSYKGANTYLA